MIIIMIIFAVIVAMMVYACVWNAGDCSREEEREDEEFD